MPVRALPASGALLLVYSAPDDDVSYCAFRIQLGSLSLFLFSQVLLVEVKGDSARGDEAQHARGDA